MTLGRVRKRDGRTVPFDRAKIRDAVLGAQNAVGQHDPGFAQEVAELVTLELERRHARGGPARAGSPHIEEIQDLVERALIELGAAPVAKAYILYRDRHARMRAAVSVDEGPRGDAAPGTGGSLDGAARPDRPPRVRHAGGVSEWGKGRIVAALMNEADLARPLAEDVAARVERRVFDSGLKRISTGLVRELVDNELVDLGLAGALRRHEAIGVPRHDLRRMLSEPPAAPVAPAEASAGPRVDEPAAEGRGGGRAVEAQIGGAVLRRYVLEDVLEEHLVDRHQSGDLATLDLDRPHLYLTQAVPAELLLRGATDARSPFDVLGEVAAACATVSRGVVLEGPAVLLSTLARGGRGGAGDGLAGWLLALGAVARAAGVNVDLSGLGARHGALVARLVEALAALEGEASGDPLPRLFLELAEVEAALAAGAGGERGTAAAVERLLRSGRIVPCWSRAGERVAGPGCHRRAREKGALACGGAVALNLARVARRAGPWREDRMLELQAELVRAALDVLEPLARFQREHRGARSGEVRGRVAYALTPVGLREALRHLGDGELRPSQGARLLGVLGEVARRYAAERRLSVVVTPFFGAAAAARFAALDAGLPHVRQGRLFGERGAAPEGGPDAPYSHGFRLSPVPGLAAGAAEAILLSTVAGGALTELVRATSAERGGRAAARRQWLAPEPGAGGELLAAWRDFEAGRAAEHAGDAGSEEPRAGEPGGARVLAPVLFAGADGPTEAFETGVSEAGALGASAADDDASRGADA